MLTKGTQLFVVKAVVDHEVCLQVGLAHCTDSGVGGWIEGGRKGAVLVSMGLVIGGEWDGRVGEVAGVGGAGGRRELVGGGGGMPGIGEGAAGV